MKKKQCWDENYCIKKDQKCETCSYYPPYYLQDKKGVKMNLEIMETNELEQLYYKIARILDEREKKKRTEIEKQKGMKAIYKLLQQDFESSSGVTEQFVIFYRKFKSEIRKALKDKIKEIKFNRGHFEISGFFKTLKNEIYYFSTSDIRWSKQDQLLIRTAKSFEDYTGGSNENISISNFEKDIQRYL